MKKIIALLLTLSMVLTFAACGEKDEETTMTVPVPTEPAIVETEPVETESVETEPIVTEPVVEEPSAPAIPELVIPTPEMPTDEAVVAAKQTNYEKVFNEGLFTMDTNSVTMNFANLFEMGMLADDAGKTLLTMSGGAEDFELELALFIVSETEAYYHRKGVEEGVAMDEWYKLEDMVNEDGESAIGEVTSTTDSLTEFQNNIKSVTYVGEIDGQDVVELEYLVPDETMESSENYATVMLILDAETYTVSAMYMEQDGFIVSADFTPVEDLSVMCELPDNITETMKAEDAAMELAMGMMMFIFSAADMGTMG